MRHQAARIHLDQADEKIGNVDGSPWIRNQIQRQSMPSWRWRHYRKAGCGRITGKPFCPQSLYTARKFCRTPY